MLIRYKKLKIIKFNLCEPKIQGSLFYKKN